MIKRGKHCIVRAFTGLICAALVCSSGTPVYASSAAADLQKKTSELQGKVDNLNEELDALTSQLEDTAAKIEKKTEEVEQATLDLAAAQVNKEAHYSAMKERIKFMYEGGNISLFEILLESEDMADFLNKAEYVSSISDYDRNMLEELQEVIKTVEEKKGKLEKQQEELTELETELEEQKTALDEKLASVSAELEKYKKEYEMVKAAEDRIKAARAAGVQVNGEGAGSYFEDAYSADAGTIALLAGILECEAGISYEGMIAVGTVIMNRVASSKFPNSIKGVVYQSGQFEPAGTGKLSRVLNRGPKKDAYKAAKAVLGGERHSSVRSCLYFNASFTGKSGVNVGDNIFW